MKMNLEICWSTAKSSHKKSQRCFSGEHEACGTCLGINYCYWKFSSKFDLMPSPYYQAYFSKFRPR